MDSRRRRDRLLLGLVAVRKLFATALSAAALLCSGGASPALADGVGGEYDDANPSSLTMFEALLEAKAYAQDECAKAENQYDNADGGNCVFVEVSCRVINEDTPYSTTCEVIMHFVTASHGIGGTYKKTAAVGVVKGTVDGPNAVGIAWAGQWVKSLTVWDIPPGGGSDGDSIFC